MCMWSLSPPVGRAAASDSALGYGVQVTFFGISGVVHLTHFQEAIWSRGESTVNTLCFNYSSQYMKQALAGGLMCYSS